VAEPDFVGLQELKLDQDKFPIDAIKEAGYEAVWLGQKTTTAWPFCLKPRAAMSY